MESESEKTLAFLLRNTRVAALATLRDEEPRVSMVAFLPAEDFSAFYILASKLAQHTADMMKDKRVSLLIAETDDKRADPQTLARISIRASAEMIQNGEPGHAPIRQKYLERFPQSAPLFQLADFLLWRIKPKGARFVAGFARAYNLTPDSLKQVSRL